MSRFHGTLDMDYSSQESHDHWRSYLVGDHCKGSLPRTADKDARIIIIMLGRLEMLQFMPQGCSLNISDTKILVPMQCSLRPLSIALTPFGTLSTVIGSRGYSL